MVDFYFDKNYFGNTPFYLYCRSDGSSIQLDEKPSDHENLLRIGSYEAWLVSKLYGFSIPSFPDLKFKRFFQKEKVSIPWELVMPKHAYKEQVHRTVSQLKKDLCSLDLEYYNKYFKQQNQIFKELRPAKIDAAFLIKTMSEQKDAPPHLKSFLPEQGYAPVPEYTRIGTRTGRLKVKKGPMILNVMKEHRKVLTSRFPGGHIWQLDYSSLEPRILLAAAGEETIPKDVYKSVIDTYDLTNVPREAIKSAVINRIFGAANHTIEEQLKDLVDYPSDIIDLVDEYFGIEALRQKLSLELSINAGSFITNFYGRRVTCEGTAPYVLLNYYIQSTGVDVCLFGFNKVVAKLKQADITNRIVPLYVLHDALFLDVDPTLEYLLPKLCTVGSMDIPKFENTNFYLQAVKEV